MKPFNSQVESVVNQQANAQELQERKLSAAQWFRDVRFSPAVNKSTVGVQTDKVTPQLLLNTANALLRISRQQQEPSAKDSLAYQKFYGPAQYFAEHIQRDAGGLARGLLWKATNRGNLDFMQPGALDPHVSSVFYDSNLSQYIDGSTPFQALDATYKTTRVGQGGIAGEDNAPDEMRVVQPSYFGYVDPVRCYSGDTQLLTDIGWKCISEITKKDLLACLVGGRLVYDHPIACYKYAFNGELCGYVDQDLSFLVTANHRMFIRDYADAHAVSSYRACFASELPEKFYLLVSQSPKDAFTQHVVLPGKGRRYELYNDFVYCVSVPGGLVFCRRNNKQGFWCHNSPQRGGVGLSSFLTKNVLKGSDGKLYQTFIDARTGKPKLVDSVTAAQSVVTTADALKDNTKSVFALGGRTGVRVVDRDKVDYYLPHPDDSYSIGSNLVPMFSGVKEMRLLMGCFHPYTPVLYYDQRGDVHITQACNVTMKDCPAVVSCDKRGNTKLIPVRKVVTRLAATNKPFYKIVTSSGRSLITSSAHRWVILQNGKLQYMSADKLKKGMRVPRTLFKYVPSMDARVLGVPLTKEIATLLGRIQRNGKINVRGRLSFQMPAQLYSDVQTAFKQLNVSAYVCTKKSKQVRLSVSDSNVLSWVNDNIGGIAHLKRVPSCMLTAAVPFVAAYLDAYSKEVDNVGMDDNGDVWLIDLQNEMIRAAMAFLFARIFTDTQYRDVPRNGKRLLALKLVPMEFSYGMVTLDTITHIIKVKSPGYMIDFDVNDDIYAAACGIITHNSKYASQAIPLVQRQVPLIQSLDRDTGKTMEELVGKKLGTRWAPKDGVVTAVRRDRIDLAYNDGTKGSVSLYKNFPANIKGFLDNKVLVKAGDKVGKNQLLASSNFTDDNGVQAMGRNLRVGYISYKGGTYQDAAILSQSAARKMTSRTMYKNTIDLDKTIRTGKKLYSTWKPQAYDKDMLAKLDNDGVALPGTVLQKGDPVVLAVQVTEPSPGTLRRRIITDKSEIWNHTYPGIVTDVTKTRKGIKVYTTVDAPVEIGDKVTGRYGNKGVVAQILPDDQMPRDSKGRPLELLLSPLGIISRTNSSQLVQTLLGKIAQKTGKTIKVPQFSQEDLVTFALRLAKQNNVPASETCFDPATGRQLKDILTGKQYIYKLKHLAESKLSARGTASYNSQGIPAAGGQQGSKRFGSMQAIALIGHSAFDTLVKDAKLIRGQANADFWRQIRTGQVPAIPGQPLVHKKFFAHLQGSGIRVRKTPQGISIFALTNKDVNDLAGPRQVKTRDTYAAKTMRPMDGGLFGTDVFGLNGDSWGYIKLQQPVLNPVMEQPVAQILRMPQAKLQAVLQGRQEYNGQTGPLAIKKALSEINMDSQTKAALEDLKSATKSAKDKALKRYVALQRIRRAGVSPDAFMLDKIPVIPPVFRPITASNGLTMVADSNYLYAQLLDARDDFKDAKVLPPEYLQKARQQIYSKFKELVGLYQPQSKKLQSKSVHGLLKWALGDQPKASAYQRKVFGSIVDTVGRGVVVPSSKIKLNEIGLPQQMAWGIFAPFITRNLVRAGYNVTQAMRMVKDRKPIAKDFLIKAMQHRPVMMNRAPSLHKLSIMGFMPKLVPGHAVQVNPSIVTPFGMDFDGDSVQNAITILCTQTFLNKFLRKSEKKVDKLKSDGIVSADLKKRSADMLTKNETVELANMTVSLEELASIGKNEKKKSATVTEWDLPAGAYVSTLNPVTSTIEVAPITKVSKHTGLKMYDCTLGISSAYTHVITASEDHSLISLDPNTLEFEKTRPEEALGRLVPSLRGSLINGAEYCIKNIKLSNTYPLSYKLGVFLGCMIGDGWVAQNGQTYIACANTGFQKYLLELLTPDTALPFKKASYLQTYKGIENRFSKQNMARLPVFISYADSQVLRDKIGCGAYNKRIPAECLAGSKAHLIGILCGLLATDGHVGVSKTASKKASLKNIAYHTTSCMLRDNLQTLCRRLGIKTAVTPYMGEHSKVTCYAVRFSLEDIAQLKKKHPSLFVIPVPEKEASLQVICDAVDKRVRISYDLVPFPRGLFCEFSYAKVTAVSKDVVISARNKGYIRRDVALRIADVLSQIDWKQYSDPCWLKDSNRTHHTPEQAAMLVNRWCALVRNDSIAWEVVENVNLSSNTEGWDCTVPGPYTFILAEGTVVQDTANFHVPVSETAIRQVKQRMFPQRNLIAMKDRRILYRPQKQYVQGLYIATRMNTKKKPRRFKNLAQARQAYRADALDVDDPIIISES